MSQLNFGGNNYQIYTGQNAKVFCGGEHTHYHTNFYSGHGDSLNIKLSTLSRKNIFLEIFNPDSRLALGLYDDLTPSQQYKLLSKALNASVFLCDEFIVMPPTFVLECQVVHKLIRNVSAYMAEGIIRMPMRDSSFGKFYEKKLVEYSEVAKDYPRMFGRTGSQAVSLMMRFSQSRIIRNSLIGEGLAQMWAQGPDTNPYWKRNMKYIPSKMIDQIRYAPQALYQQGCAVTHGLISKRIPYEQSGIPAAVIQKLLQHSYAALYINEYDLKVLSGFPLRYDAFGHGINNFPYDYEALKAALSPLGLFKHILELSAEEMISLRYRLGYSRFIQAFDLVACQSTTSSEIRMCFAQAAANSSKATKLLAKDLTRYNGNPNVTDRSEKIDIINEILLEGSLVEVQ
jgi:hypothetical protein